MNKVIHGDCLIESDNIPSGSVDLILTDLPYGTVKNAPKNWTVGNKASHGWDMSIEPTKVYEVANRILRKNGKMVLFSQEPYTTQLITEAHANIPFGYRAVWEKDTFANALLVNKAMVGLYEDILIFSKTHDTDDLHLLSDYFKKCKEDSGMTNREFNYLFSDYFGKAENRDRSVMEHYWSASQFTVPTKEIYENILQPTGYFPLPYEDIEKIDGEFKKELSSVFNLWEGDKYKSNILRYKKDYDGFHPTQKPVLLLEDLIKTFSNEGDLVVDLTCGSGSTLVAAQNTNRNYIGIEQEKEYVDIANKRIEAHQEKAIGTLI